MDYYNIINRANQLNPNNPAYWLSRGYAGRPDNWKSLIAGTTEETNIVIWIVRLLCIMVRLITATVSVLVSAMYSLYVVTRVIITTVFAIACGLYGLYRFFRR